MDGAWQGAERPGGVRPGPAGQGPPVAGHAGTALRHAGLGVPADRRPVSSTWSIVWLPGAAQLGRPVSGEHSSGTADSSASTTAGWKFAAAVPEVHSTATGRRDALARPSAVNDAERSSIRTCNRTGQPARRPERHRQRRGPRPRRHDDLPQPAPSELVREHGRERHQRVTGPASSSRGASCCFLRRRPRSAPPGPAESGAPRLLCYPPAVPLADGIRGDSGPLRAL